MEPQLPTDAIDASAKRDSDLVQTLADIELELSRIKGALGLLGVRACSSCKIFFRTSEPAALFHAGEAVCYRCIPDWWASRRPQLDSDLRERIEHRLVHWLVQQHGARVIHHPEKQAESACETRIIASCMECRGTGKHNGGRCPHCYDGNVWVVMKPQ